MVANVVLLGAFTFLFVHDFFLFVGEAGCGLFSAVKGVVVAHGAMEQGEHLEVGFAVIIVLLAGSLMQISKIKGHQNALFQSGIKTVSHEVGASIARLCNNIGNLVLSQSLTFSLRANFCQFKPWSQEY